MYKQMSGEDRLTLIEALAVLNRRANEELASFGNIRSETNRGKEILVAILEDESRLRLVSSKTTSSA